MERAKRLLLAGTSPQRMIIGLPMARMNLGAAAICGLGVTRMTHCFGKSSYQGTSTLVGGGGARMKDNRNQDVRPISFLSQKFRLRVKLWQRNCRD